MSYQNYDLLVDEFPSEQDTIYRLRDLLLNTKPDAAYSIGRLIDLIEPESTYIFPRLMDRAENISLVSKAIRVESPDFGYISDFKTILDIPGEIYDQHQGEEISVTPEMLKIIYKPFSNEVI